MAKFLNAVENTANPTMGQLELVEERSSIYLVSANGKTYGISKRRVAESDCTEDTELFISRDGKWLIPADTTREAIQPDW